MVESKGDDHGGDHDHDHDHDHDGEGSGENFCDELWFDDPDKWENVQDVESVDEDTFILDGDGRIPFAGMLDFKFRNAPAALSKALSCPETLDAIVRDCQAVSSARAKKLEYSTGETYWMQADGEPRNSLEMLALDIFRAHTGRARYDKSKSGAEWWTQVIDEGDDIGWHWDKDYDMESSGINVHPSLSTVTYLSNTGGPTMILSKRGPMVCHEEEAISGEAKKAWVSLPCLGKHICFDGRYLHGAPAELALGNKPSDTNSVSESNEEVTAGKKRDASGEAKPTAAKDEDVNATSNGTNERGRKRVTFLVNVWINHVPKSAALPATTSKVLRTGKLDLDLSPAGYVPPKLLRVAGDDEIETKSAGMDSKESNGEAAPSESKEGAHSKESNGDAASNGVQDEAHSKESNRESASNGAQDGAHSKESNEEAASNGAQDGAHSKESNGEAASNGAQDGAHSKESNGEAASNGAQDGAHSKESNGEVASNEAQDEAHSKGSNGESASNGAKVGADVALEGYAEVKALDMRWEFGEVGEDAEEQVHLRHEVVVPVPVGIADGGLVAARDCLCVVYPSSRKPRVSRLGGESSEEEEDDEDEDDEDDDGEGDGEGEGGTDK